MEAETEPNVEWDEEKAESNALKHGVSFMEAATVLADPSSVVLADPDHSDDEERFVILGYSNYGRLIFVSYTERGEALRIISARRASRQEARNYEEQ